MPLNSKSVLGIHFAPQLLLAEAPSFLPGERRSGSLVIYCMV